MKKTNKGSKALLCALMLSISCGVTNVMPKAMASEIVGLQSHEQQNVIASGAMSDTVSWFLYADGTLSMEGEGYVPSSNEHDTYVPWDAYKEEIRFVHIDDAVDTKGMAFWFSDCVNLEGIDFVLHSGNSDVSYMFRDCKKLKTLPEGFTLAPYVYYANDMFSGSGLEKLPDNFRMSESTYEAAALFENTQLETLPEGFMVDVNGEPYTGATVEAYNMFAGCKKLKALPEGFWIHGSGFKQNNFGYMFYGNDSLIFLPDSLVWSDFWTFKEKMFYTEHNTPIYFSNNASNVVKTHDWNSNNRYLIHKVASANDENYITETNTLTIKTVENEILYQGTQSDDQELDTLTGFQTTVLDAQQDMDENGYPYGDLTLTVKEKTFGIQYDMNGGTQIPQKDIKDIQSTILPSTTPIKAGYTFTNWTYEDSIINETTTWNDVVGQNEIDTITLVANWEANTYVVSYETGTEDVIETKTATWEDQALLPEVALSKDGYAFMGWEYNGMDVTSETALKDLMMESRNRSRSSIITLNAKWSEQNVYNVYFENDGTNLERQTLNLYFNDEIALPKLVKAGYTFEGWSLDGVVIENNTRYADLVASRAEKELHFIANWKQDINQPVIPEVLQPKHTNNDIKETTESVKEGSNLSTQTSVQASYVQTTNMSEAPKGSMDTPVTGDSSSIFGFAWAMSLSILALGGILVLNKRAMKNK